MLGCFIRSFPIEDNALMGTKLVVVVEADEDLSLELLPLDARTHRPDLRYTWVR